MPARLILGFLLLSMWACESPAPSSLTDGDYLIAPFTGIDTLATNDWWNRATTKIIDLKVDRDSVVAFGAYTVANNTLKLTAQLYPLYPGESREVRLEIQVKGKWEELGKRAVKELGWSTTFRIDNWDKLEAVPYRLRHGENASYVGSIRAVPTSEEVLVLAAFSCNSNKDRGGRENYVRNVAAIDPDLVFFAGDQSYDHTEHTAAWLKFGQQFRETFRHRPMVSIPDDHDIGQGNL